MLHSKNQFGEPVQIRFVKYRKFTSETESDRPIIQIIPCLFDHELFEYIHNRWMVGIFQGCHIEVSLPARGNQRENFQIQRVDDRDIWCYGDSETICHESGNYMVLGYLVRNIRVSTDLIKQMIDDMTQTASALIDPLLVLQCLFQMNLRLGSQWMIRRNDDDQILLGNRDKFDQRFIIDLGTKADIVFLFF